MLARSWLASGAVAAVVLGGLSWVQTGSAFAAGQDCTSAFVATAIVDVDNDGVFEISSEEHLVFLSATNNAQGELGRDYVLTASLDLNSCNFTPIGDTTDPFTGSFTATGHTILGLNVDVTAQAGGLFGVTDGATITDVTIEDATISVVRNDGDGTSTVYSGGVLIGEAKAGTTVNGANSQRGSVSAPVAGGVVGANFGTLTDVLSTANVTSGVGSDRESAFAAGGLVGHNHTTGEITGSIATGDVQGFTELVVSSVKTRE